MQHFTHADVEKPMEGRALYRKKTLTLAKRVDGPFTVETMEGTLACQDGWLCIDAAGLARNITRKDECGWCGDYRDQHHPHGCKVCGNKPWERGAYACRGFVEPGDEAPQVRELLPGYGTERRN